MFKSLFKSLGFGNVKIDARLRTPSVPQGGTLQGDVYIMGSDSHSTIDQLWVKVITNFKREGSDDYEYNQNITLAQYKLFDRLPVAAKEQKSVPFSIQLPFETPVTTIGYQRVYLSTVADTSAIFDPGDTDAIQITPHPHSDRVLRAVQNIGFTLYKVDCEYNTRFGGQYPFVQEFEFKPTGEFRGRLDELEAYLKPHPNGCDVTFQIDRRGGWAEFFGTDESYARLQLTLHDLNDPGLENNLRNYIWQQMR